MRRRGEITRGTYRGLGHRNSHSLREGAGLNAVYRQPRADGGDGRAERVLGEAVTGHEGLRP